MSLIEQAKKDWQTITTDTSGFGVVINLTTPNDSDTVELKGLHAKHHIGIDTDGNLVNSKNAHISFSEQQLIDASYPYRNTGDEVALYNHKISVKDSTGQEKKYVIREWFPDETIGVILCILGDRE